MLLIMKLIKTVIKTILASRILLALIWPSRKTKILMRSIVSQDLTLSHGRHPKLRSRPWKVCHTLLMWPVTDWSQT